MKSLALALVILLVLAASSADARCLGGRCVLPDPTVPAVCAPVVPAACAPADCEPASHVRVGILGRPGRHPVARVLSVPGRVLRGLFGRK